MPRLGNGAMPCVKVVFALEPERWTRDYDVERGATVWQLKEQMLGPEAGKQDLQAFELRLLGRRVPDSDKIYQEQVLDFEYLGPTLGAKRSREEERELEDWERRKAEEEAARLFARPKVTQQAAAAPAKPKDDNPFNTAPVVKQLPPLPEGEHEIMVTIDRDMELVAPLTVWGGQSIWNVKEQLAAQDPTGMMDVATFGLGITVTEGEERATPLADITVLTERHMRLEITDPYVETEEPGSKVAYYQVADRSKVKPPGPLPPRWEVVGGGDKGGILVREGMATTSPQAPSRLATGAWVNELEIEGERLRFQKIWGEGPETGWVSLSLSGRDLLEKREYSAEEKFTVNQALDLQEELMWGFAQPEFQAGLDALFQEFPEKKGFKFTKKRNELFLSVQSAILPKYGFEGSPTGVMYMMRAFNQPHVQCEEMGWNAEQLNNLMRM